MEEERLESWRVKLPEGQIRCPEATCRPSDAQWEKPPQGADAHLLLIKEVINFSFISW